METTAIKQMTAEHRNIETVIRSLQDAVSALENQQRLNVQKLGNVVEFLRVYVEPDTFSGPAVGVGGDGLSLPMASTGQPDIASSASRSSSGVSG